MNIFNMFKTCKLIPIGSYIIGNTIKKCTDVSRSVLYSMAAITNWWTSMEFPLPR